MENGASKRRSLLVQPGTLSGSIARSTHADAVITNEPQQRQTGGIRRTQSIRAPAAPQSAVGDGVATSGTTTTSGLRRTVSTKPARPMSMIAPPTSRLQSSSLASSTSAMPTLRPSAGRTIGHARAQSFQTIQEHAPGSTVTSPQHTRAPSTASTSPTKMPAPTLRPSVRQIPSIRPEFNMNQQHFSPKKSFAPKPASMSLVNAPSKTAGLSEMSTEIQSLQTQLLQLEILHDAFRKSLREWNASAEAKLRNKFLDTAAKQEQIVIMEREIQLQENVRALQQWGVKGGDDSVQGRAAPEMDEYLQILCSVVIETSRLSMNDGRIDLATRDIEQWMAQAEEIWASRQGNMIGEGVTSLPSGIGFTEDLHTHWANEITALQRRLLALRNDMELLPPAAEGSNLQRVVSGFRALIGLVQENLGIVVEVREVMDRAEREWIEREARALIMAEA